MKNKDITYYDDELDLVGDEPEREYKKPRKSRAMRIIDRIFGFLLTTGILFGVSGLAVEYVLVKGPSPALRETFINTMLETRRFGFIAHVYLSDDEVNEIVASRQSSERINTSAPVTRNSTPPIQYAVFFCEYPK
mgnify:CR=1 FL=1